MTDPTALYRFFAADDMLLYVGITLDIGGRWHHHSRKKPWWSEVAHATVNHYPTREAALLAEEAAIKTESPAHNIVHNRRGSRPSTPAPAFTIGGDAPRGGRIWEFQHQEYRATHRSALWLIWELDGEAMTDDWLPAEIDAVELWNLWRRKYPRGSSSPFGEGTMPIWWYVAGDHTLERAPFQDQRAFGDFVYPDFLTEFTWPRDARTGEPLKWTELPVADKAWRTRTTSTKGGFIQEATGWKPGPLQAFADIHRLEEAARL